MQDSNNAFIVSISFLSCRSLCRIDNDMYCVDQSF